jgi:tetratricopeptide (TPR) repeat protein
MHLPTLKHLLTVVLVTTCFMLQSGCQRQESNKPRGHQQSAQVAATRETPTANESPYDTILRELQTDPDNVEALYHLGDLYYRDGLYEKAVENFRKVVDQDPDRGYVYLKLGTSLNRLQRFAEALDAFGNAVANLQDPAIAYNNMGITYGKLGRYQEEIDALQKALNSRPRYASARYNLGVTLIKVGNLDGARQQYQALNEFDLTMAQALLDEIEKAAPKSDKR